MSAAAAETFLEKFLELCVEDGVDDGVECTVDVAQPGDGAHQTGGDVTGQTHGSRRVDHEERSPAEQEAPCILKTETQNQRRSAEAGASTQIDRFWVERLSCEGSQDIHLEVGSPAPIMPLWCQSRLFIPRLVGKITEISSELSAGSRQ